MDTKDLAMPDISKIVAQHGSMPMIKVKKEQYDRWVNNCMSEKNKTQTSWIYINGKKRKLHNAGYTLWIDEGSRGDVDIKTFLYYDEEKEKEEDTKEEEKEEEDEYELICKKLWCILNCKMSNEGKHKAILILTGWK
tara:strand:+ start:101 stop:511 length:411 start_codon:yes stop_codon:yes gene_type:complete